MPALSTFALVNDILDSHAQAPGPDLPAYRNHVTRLLHFVFAMDPQLQSAAQPLLIAGAFHDLGIGPPTPLITSTPHRDWRAIT